MTMIKKKKRKKKIGKQFLPAGFLFTIPAHGLQKNQGHPEILLESRFRIFPSSKKAAGWHLIDPASILSEKDHLCRQRDNVEYGFS